MYLLTCTGFCTLRVPLALDDSPKPVKHSYMGMSVTRVARVPEAETQMVRGCHPNPEESLFTMQSDYKSIKKPNGFYNSNSSFGPETKHHEK